MKPSTTSMTAAAIAVPTQFRGHGLRGQYRQRQMPTGKNNSDADPVSVQFWKVSDHHGREHDANHRCPSDGSAADSLIVAAASEGTPGLLVGREPSKVAITSPTYAAKCGTRLPTS